MRTLTLKKELSASVLYSSIGMCHTGTYVGNAVTIMMKKDHDLTEVIFKDVLWWRQKRIQMTIQSNVM